MLKKTAIAFALLGLAAGAGAQQFAPSKTAYAATDPTTFVCAKGDYWLNWNTSHLWGCNLSDVNNPIWVDLSAAAGGFPLLAPDGCVAAPYSFLGQPTWGLCRDDLLIRLQAHDGVNNEAFLSLESDEEIFLTRRNTATGRGARVQITSSNAQLQTIGATSTIAFIKAEDIVSGTFASWTNVAVPTRTIVFTFNSSLPQVLFRLDDASLFAELRINADDPQIRFRVGNVTNSGNIQVDFDAVFLTATTASGQSLGAMRARGWQLPYIPAGVASAATITPFGNVFHVTGTTNIDTITAPQSGTCVVMVFDDVLTVGDLSGNIDLAAAFVSTANDTLSLCFVGAVWYETGRSVN